MRSLLALFSRYLRNETRELHADGIRIRFIGERDKFSARLRRLMDDAEALTANNTDTTLVIAADYGGQWDITHSARELGRQVAEGQIAWQDITVERLDAGTSLASLPDPDLCIRTGGDHRISNFMLWQFAYSELYFSDILWPDFGEPELERAIADFAGRERRFGLREGEDKAAAGKGKGGDRNA